MFQWLRSSNAARFNTQPPEGGWTPPLLNARITDVSTHSRPKAAGINKIQGFAVCLVSTHSRPKAAGITQKIIKRFGNVSTHSRPKAAG